MKKNIGERIQKKLAHMGLGSRRAIERMMVEGRVTVDGVVVSLGTRLLGKEMICIDGHVVTGEDQTPDLRVLAYHKEEGEICTRFDPQGRSMVFSKLPHLKVGRWIIIGRLDFNTSGLLLFTTDGALAHRLMHPSSKIEREYMVRIFGDVASETLMTLTEGVMLEDGRARFINVTAHMQESGANRWFRVSLDEGRNREVRRLWESQGIHVNRLKRIRFGSMTLPRTLQRGCYRYLTREEVDRLYSSVNILSPYRRKR